MADMTPTPCVISVADHAGWAHLVCVAAPRGVPAVIERRRVTTIDAGLPAMPYHHESLRMPVAAANALITRVRRSVAERTARALRDVFAGLSPWYRIVALAIREPSFPDLPDTVAVVRQSYQLQCAADGMMYQLALCAAARDLGLQVHLCGRGEEIARAATRLDVDSNEIESFISVAGRPSGPPWTEEHRRAYAAGIAVLASGARHRITLQRITPQG
jgi:hypothetical protein